MPEPCAIRGHTSRLGARGPSRLFVDAYLLAATYPVRRQGGYPQNPNFARASQRRLLRCRPHGTPRPPAEPGVPPQVRACRPLTGVFPPAAPDTSGGTTIGRDRWGVRSRAEMLQRVVQLYLHLGPSAAPGRRSLLSVWVSLKMAKPLAPARLPIAICSTSSAVLVKHAA